MRSLGMKPVLGAFSGRLPDAIKAKFPDAKITETGSWGGFNPVYLLDPK